MRLRDLPWQILILWIYSLVLGFVFMLAAYGTAAQWATIIYWLAAFVFGAVLLILKYGLLRGQQLPFEFSKNAPAYAYTLSFLLVPAMYFLAQVITWLLTGQLATGSWVASWLNFGLAEVFSHFLNLTAIPVILPPWLGSLSTDLQEYALQLSDVAPAEELFKTAVISSILLIILWRKEQVTGEVKKIGYGLVFVVLTAINGLWVLMHGILSYHAVSDFIIALIDGELLLGTTWFFGNPFPAVISHGTWNNLGALGYLTLYVMLGIVMIFGPLTIFFYFRRPRHK